MVDTHINIWLKFCNVWAAASCPGPSRFGFMQGESKTSWFRKINKTWRVCPHFHSARLANTTWPHKSSRWWYSDTDIPAQPSPLGECSNASCNLACSRKNFFMAQSAIPRLKFLDYHHMIMQAMRSCEMCCELPYILKKKCFTEMEEAPRSRKIVARLDSFLSLLQRR